MKEQHAPISAYEKRDVYKRVFMFFYFGRIKGTSKNVFYGKSAKSSNLFVALSCILPIAYAVYFRLLDATS